MRRSIFRISNTIDHGIAMNVLPDNVAQKWLVMVGLHVNNMRIQTNTSGPTIPYPAMDKNVSRQQKKLEIRKVPISQRLSFFDVVVSSAASFAGRHRTMYKEHIQTLDVNLHKFCRSIAGPPPHIDWTFEWHEILFV